MADTQSNRVIKRLTFTRTSYPTQPVKYWLRIDYRDGRLIKNEEVEITQQIEQLQDVDSTVLVAKEKQAL